MRKIVPLLAESRDTHETLPSFEPSIDPLLRRAARTSLVSYPGFFTGSERFELVRRLGRGGFGVVFEAIDHAQGGRVALKVLRPNRADQLYRFKREFRSLGEIVHPHLVRLYELVASGPDVFFTMELIEGVSFLEHVGSSPERARVALRQLAAGLNALHGAGVLHRDIKPSNVMVANSGRVMLLDFGLAVELEAVDQTAELVGTPLYMSPEQCAEEPLGTASDWYAVGVMLYEVLTGRPPFAGSALEMIARKQGAPPPAPSTLIPSLPRDLDELCAALLLREPERRPSGDEVLQRLSGAVAIAATASREELFIGRDAERATLRATFAQAAAGRRAVAMVRGPSGIGKSTLLKRFLDDVRRERPESVILAGRCYERESVPYKALDAVIDELARYLRRLSDVDSALLMPRAPAALVQLFPVLAEVPAFQRASDVRERADLKSEAMAALRELLVRLSDRRPVVLCVDDLQWGDIDSAVLLAELVRSPDPPAICVVLGFREEEATTSPLLKRLAELRETTLRGLPVTEVRLGSLADADAKQLAAALLTESQGDTARAEAIARESHGNPFLLGELTRHAESELALHELVQRRVARLDEGARRVLEVVAVSGRPIESDIVAAAAQMGSALRDALATLRAERLLRVREADSERQLETYHDRIREAVGNAIEPARLRAIHLRLADALEGAAADPARIALHLVDGGAPERALGYLKRAAEKAYAALAFDEAAYLYQRALELSSDKVERLALELGRGEALSSAGHGVEAARIFLAAAPRVDELRGIDLQRRAAEELLICGQLEEGYAALSGVLAALGLSAPRSRTGAMARVVLGRVRRALGGDGFQERDPASLPERERLRVDTLCGLALALWMMDPLTGAALQVDHLRLALRSGDRARISAAWCMEATVVALGGVNAAAATQRIIDRARRLSEGLGRRDIDAALSTVEGGAALLQGRWLDAWTMLGEAELKFGESSLGHSSMRTNAQYLRLMSLFWMGRSAVASVHLPAMLGEMEQRGHLMGWTWLKIIEMWTLVWSGRLDDAKACAQTARARLSTRGFQLQRWYLEFGEIFISLFERDGEGAWRRAHASWPLLKKGFASQVQRVAARWMRANAALGRAVTVPSVQAAMLSEARGLARLIDGEDASWAKALARSIYATIASVSGDDEAALRLLSEAEPLLESCHLESLVAAVRSYRGRMIGGEAGRALIDRAEAWMAQQHVMSNALWGQLPGRWPNE